MGSLLFPGVWQAYPASLKLACAGAGSSLLMCCYGDLAKVASTNRKEGLILSHPENNLGISLNEVRRTGPWRNSSGEISSWEGGQKNRLAVK